MEKLIVDKGMEYRLIRDNLYCDKAGNIYLKSIDVSSADSGDPDQNWESTKIRWIDYVYFDSVPSADGNKPLKNVVDTSTFKLDYTDSKQGADFYKDKDRAYFHKWMADGGTLSIFD